MKVKNDHRSKFPNLSNWKEEAWKKKIRASKGLEPVTSANTDAWTQLISLVPNVWIYSSVARASRRCSRRSRVRIPSKPPVFFSGFCFPILDHPEKVTSHPLSGKIKFQCDIIALSVSKIAIFRNQRNISNIFLVMINKILSSSSPYRLFEEQNDYLFKNTLFWRRVFLQ